ncbi:MAG: lipase [Chitinophagaceae bacterium]|nr:lipase [Chitinophagaceae bacterium]
MSIASNKMGSASKKLGAETLQNVAYGSDPFQKMDVYLPAGRSQETTPVLLLLHGGGWIGGDKRDFQSAVDYFKLNLPHFAIVNINYRLATLNAQNLWPTQIDDAKKAVAFIDQKSGEYQINNEQLAVAGASAGAHLALLLAYRYNHENKIKAAIDLFGPTDLVSLYNNSGNNNYPMLLSLFLKGSPVSNPKNYETASPVSAITKNSPPTLILHGSDDRTVPVSQSERLHAVLNSFNVKNQLIVYPGERHGWYGRNLTDTYNKMLAFLKENLNDEPGMDLQKVR